MKITTIMTLFLVMAMSLGLYACQDNNQDQSSEFEEVYSNLDYARCYEMAEFGVTVELPESINVYDADAVNITACINGPDGAIYNFPMFYYEEYQRSYVGSREVLNKVGEGQFRFRFTPIQKGEYNFYINMVQMGVVKRYPANGFKTFVVDAASKNGFLQVASDNAHLQFANGQPFIGIGNNFCGWEWAGVDNMAGTYDYDKWFNDLADNGANMTQFDFCEGDQLEWTKVENELEWSDCYNGLNYYNQKTAFKADYKASLAEYLGLYYRLTLFHWEDFDVETDSFPDWGWSRNPYNSANGGPVNNVSEFFTNAEAKRAVKNYLRYIVARYGYSSSLMMYELFNEVDAPDMSWGGGNKYIASLSAITKWHEEMSQYIRSLDVYQHIITTSCASSSYGSEFWAIDDIDITTIHRYTMYNGGGYEAPYETVKSLKYLVGNRLSATNKPTVAGEFALSPGGDIQRENDKTGVVFHNSLYASVFAGSLGTAMSWNWGSYVDEYDLYYHYRGINTLFANEDLTDAVKFDNLKTAENGTIWYMGMIAHNKAFLWIKDSMYDYCNIMNGYTAQKIDGSTLSFNGLKAGNYIVEIIDTYTGKIISQETINVGTEATVTYPDFYKDIAVKVTSEEDYYQSYDMYSGNDNNGHISQSSYTLQNGNSLTLYASGYDLGGTADSGRYAYLTIKGDFTYIARLDKTNYSGNGAKAGIMVRDSLASSAKMVFLGSYNNANYLALYRTQAGMPARNSNYGYASMGMYLKVVRVGKVITTYISDDGVNYEQLSQTEFSSLAEDLYVGVMAVNKNTLGYNKAEFSHIEVLKGKYS